MHYYVWVCAGVSRTLRDSTSPRKFGHNKKAVNDRKQSHSQSILGTGAHSFLVGHQLASSPGRFLGLRVRIIYRVVNIRSSPKWPSERVYTCLEEPSLVRPR